MIHTLRYAGDFFHMLSVDVFLVILAYGGNASGVSLKTQKLFLVVFLMRYIDVLTNFYGWYNTVMKLFFVATAAAAVYIMSALEPAKSTYSPGQDSMDHLNLIYGAGGVAMLIHLLGSGVVDIKGSSGQEFEVHFQKYSWLEFAWTFSICLEPLAMLPQLYIFWHNRLLKPEVQLAIALMGTYRVCYLCFWAFQAPLIDGFQHHYLMYIAGALQTLTYIDFILYHLKVVLLYLVGKDNVNSLDDEADHLMGEVEASWRPGDSPGPEVFEMKQHGKLGII